MKSIKDMTQPELAAFIDSHLKENGIDVVLSGGTAVEIYSDGKYVTKDIDFIENGFIKRSKLVKIMAEIGFEYQSRFFTHSDTQFIVEFPAGPPSLGKEPVSRINTIHFSTGTLRLLSPTDCVKDRLASYFYFDDMEALEQSKMVIKSIKVNLNEVERWARNEGLQIEFKKIRNQLTSK